MEKKWKIIRVIPILLAVGFVPLIVTAKKYDIGLNCFDWFSDSDSSIDLFLYWKGQGLILLAFLMLLFAAVSRMGKKEGQPEWQKLRVPEMAWLALYLVLALLSALFSSYRDFALWGSYEQWEGVNVILAYGVLLAYTYLMVDSEKLLRLAVYGIVAGSFVMGLIGAGQFLGLDLFRGELGQAIMNLLSETKMKYSFNFPVGWVYATLYNPNYVGSYAALVLPILVAVSVIKWKELSRLWTVLAMAGTCLMTVALLGSQSLTGCVGVIVSLLFLLIYMWPRLMASLGWRKILAGAAALGILCSVIFFLFPEEIKFGTDKLFHPKEDYHVIQKMLSTEKGLEVTTVGDNVFYLNLTGNTESPFAVTENDGREIPLVKDEERDCYVFQDERFTNFRFYETSAVLNGTGYEAVRIFNPTINKEWTIAKVKGEYLVYNAFRKFDELREIPAWGFEENQHFGDKRGYIWSRTFPLLKDYILLGSGPNTFTEVFPNDDYVGKTNMNYNGVTVTKPHNMYLQTWVQTGLLSLIAFLLLFFWYFVKSLKLYWNRTLTTISEKFGLALMVALFGYMVTGIANDSTVAVAPVFWGMLGLGMAVNRMVKKEQG